MNVYSFTVTSAMGTGNLTASVAAISGTLVPQLTFSAATEQVLVMSDSGPVVQNLPPGTYHLTVSVQAGAGYSRLTTEFVQGSLPPTPIALGTSTATLLSTGRQWRT